MQNISSEQELKQLLDEGNISKEEYQELKRAMAERDAENESDCDINIKGDFQLELKSRDLGKIALVLVLGGIALFAFAIWSSHNYRHPTDPNLRRGVGSWNIVLFFGMELAGFVMGIISWKNGFGKAAAITAGILLLLSILFVA
jgi:hypothetical protein